MCPTRAQSGRQSSETNSGSISLLLYRGPAQSPLWTERDGELFPPASTLHIHQCKKGLLQLPTVVHHESHWYPVPAVSAMVPVPKWLWDSPPGSARHHSPRVPFTYKYPSLFKVSQAHRQDTGLGFRTSELHA